MFLGLSSKILIIGLIIAALVAGAASTVTVALQSQKPAPVERPLFLYGD